MIACDYLIIGSGFAGIGLKYKLMGKTIMIDKNPFQYKIGESHIPDLIHADPGIFSLIPKIIKMKSFTRKLGTVFCDSYHGQYASNTATPLGERFTFHCERQELERLLVKELSIEIRQETITKIDLSRNIVVTDCNIYRFKKYLLDCSGPAMAIAKKLDIVTSIDQFKGMKAQWSYWAIDRVKEDMDSWAQWTVLNKIGQDSWIWQIPIYNSSILSMGMLHRGEPLPDDDFLQYVQERSAACYELTSIAKNPQRAVKSYMSKVHSRLHYSRRSRKCSGKNWILVGDAYCFADPVYSVGSGVAMLEAITIANNLNKNQGQFDHAWYEKNCNALIKSVIKGISTWYSGTAFNKKVNDEVNRTVLRGGFSRHFKPSKKTSDAIIVQQDMIDVFLLSVDMYPKSSDIKVYYFNKNSFIRKKNALDIVLDNKIVSITNKIILEFFEKYLIGEKLSFDDIYLAVELHLPILKDKVYLWNLIRLIEVAQPRILNKDQMYCFHPEKYEIVGGQLKVGDQGLHLMFKNPETIDFLEKLKGKILFSKELVNLVNKTQSPRIQEDMKIFLETFHDLYAFGQNFNISGKLNQRLQLSHA